MKTVSAIYSEGVFRPEQPVDLAQGTRVEIPLPDSTAAKRPLTHEELKARFPNSYATWPAERAEELRRAIEEGGFDEIEPELWK